MPLTDEQQAFLDAVAEGRSIQLEALAGTGKTTTLVEGAKQMPKGLVLSFNKAIQLEAKDRFPEGWSCLTTNGLGLKALANFLGAWPQLETGKITGLTKEHASGPRFAAVRALVEAARTHGLVPKGAPGSPLAMLKDEEINWYNLASHYDIPLDRDGNVVELARKVLIASIHLAFKGIVDFQDQLYIPTLWGAQFPKFPSIIVDEAQDLNALQHRMLRLCSMKGKTQVVSAGDRRQGIYAFRGALADSMDQLKAAFSLEELPLTMTWRCSRAVVRHTNELVPELRYAPTATGGSVRRLEDEEWCIDHIHEEDFVLCRNNAPLVQLAYEFIADGRPVKLSSLAGMGFKTIINRLRPRSVPDLIVKVEEWAERECLDANAKKEWGRAEQTRDKADTLITIAQNSGAKHIDDLENHIKLLTQSKEGVALMTGHKAKGLEAPRVFHLNSFLVPAKWAKEAGEWQLQQEFNLDYVIRTRAMRDLIYINRRRKREGANDYAAA